MCGSRKEWIVKATMRSAGPLVAIALAAVLGSCGSSAKTSTTTAPAPASGGSAPAASTTITAASPTSAPAAAPTSAVAVHPAGPTQAVDAFYAAEKAGDCATAFAYLADPLRSQTRSASALCASLHKDPVISFKPSTLINQTPSQSLVQVEVTTQSEGDQFYIDKEDFHYLIDAILLSSNH
jgi:hypothetical protein